MVWCTSLYCPPTGRHLPLAGFQLQPLYIFFFGHMTPGCFIRKSFFPPYFWETQEDIIQQVMHLALVLRLIPDCSQLISWTFTVTFGSFDESNKRRNLAKQWYTQTQAIKAALPSPLALYWGPCEARNPHFEELFWAENCEKEKFSKTVIYALAHASAGPWLEPLWGG